MTRLLLGAALIMFAALSAGAQTETADEPAPASSPSTTSVEDLIRDNPEFSALSIPEMSDLVTIWGHTVIPTPVENLSVEVRTPAGLRYSIVGDQCEADRCDIYQMMTFFPAPEGFTSEQANQLNLTMAHGTVSFIDNNILYTRSVLFAGGTRMANFLIEVDLFLKSTDAIYRQVQPAPLE